MNNFYVVWYATVLQCCLLRIDNCFDGTLVPIFILWIPKTTRQVPVNHFLTPNCHQWSTVAWSRGWRSRMPRPNRWRKSSRTWHARSIAPGSTRVSTYGQCFGFWMFIRNPDFYPSRIQKQLQKRGLKKKFDVIHFLKPQISQNVKLFIFEMLKKKNVGQISKNYRTFYPKSCH